MVEIMVVIGLTLLVAGIAFLILRSGLELMAKNTSMNIAHQEARMAMLQMQKEMHQAVSPASLTNANGNAIGGDGPAAGISFHVFAGGPYPVMAPAVPATAAGQAQFVTMDLGGFQAKAGQRLVIANHDIEIDIKSDASGTGTRPIELVEKIPNAITITYKDDRNEDVSKTVYGIITTRVSYRIKDGELLYVDREGKTTVLASDITSDKPFSRPVRPGVSSSGRFLATANLSRGKKGGKSHKFKSVSMILNAEVPARAILCFKP
jgi:hypothetical protein